MSEFSEWLQAPLDGSLVSNSGKATPRVNGKAPRRSGKMHNYRLIDPNEYRGVPATNGSQADDPRKRHKLAAIRNPELTRSRSPIHSSHKKTDRSIGSPARHALHHAGLRKNVSQQ
jgi:hypothetical protein